ncbi:alpha-L-fucosidase [Agromyces atrinae]|uniref:alpha-L-fucosidase n=1 Tax=Agromyces atrinae TaxID=592376 RepID=A0A4V1R1Y1_9MICO|nr:alpha-L-fucosidase [Agromyces atrinae]NYD67036.1 alpha-L-fucosidase [Agromyces atrinae]RXZ85236.1 alpha-L-fucosidase [Agromyces atrinae]RXZ85344.1 alpha-L-fucosidase [Agromyces atrinae]
MTAPNNSSDAPHSAVAVPRPDGLPRWARDASLGIFIHWGPYSVPAWAEPTGALGEVPDDEWFAHNAYAEWYANTIRIEGSHARAHHDATYGGAPYLDFLDAWTAEDYDPRAWAELFRAAGADYVVPTTKHHDGVVLWPAPGADDRSTATRGPKRDLISPLADAVRDAGLRFAVYYSGGLDWSFEEFPPHLSSDDVHTLRPTGPDYAEYAYTHVIDLIDRYRPSLIWNDINWPDAGKADGPHSLDRLFAHYRSVVPDGIVNDRWGVEAWDYRTSEYSHGTENESTDGWEQCRGLGFSFGYNSLEDESLTLSARELARLYSDVVSRGGRLLLNVGPTASGVIPEVQRRTLEGFGEWMTRVKPLTLGRSVLDHDELEITSSTEGAWWRAWRHGEEIVIITDDAELDVIGTPAGETVTVILLPSE